MTTPLSNRQIPDQSILDISGKQAYLGNSFMASSGLVVGQSVETPLIALANPSSNAFPSQVGLFQFYRKLFCSSSSAIATFRYYLDPIGASGGSAVTPNNLRPGALTASKMTFTTSPTVAGVAQVQTINTVADIAGSLNNTYLLLSSINPVGTQKNWYMWFNVNSAGTDPMIAGKTGIEVDLATGATANAVATAMRAALNALVSDFVATGATNAVICTNVNAGPATAASDGVQPTGFTFHNTTPGSLNYGTLLSLLEVSLAQVDSGALFVLDPGYSLLVTAQISTASSVAAEMIWNEM